MHGVEKTADEVLDTKASEILQKLERSRCSRLVVELD
jgi:hypothetical protein